MRTRRSLEHDAALSRRLAQLGGELSAHRAGARPDGVRPARPEPIVAPDPTRASWWDEHTRPAGSRHQPTAQPTAQSQAPSQAPSPRPLLEGPPRTGPPGRHAAPRPRGPAGLGAAQLAVVSVLAAVGLAVTCWWLVRGSAHPSADLEAAPAPGLVSTSAEAPPGVQPIDATPGPDQQGEATAATVTVDVAGKVRHPGIAVLDAGARVVDAVQAAGGARPGVDLTGLNLARVLVDGEQVVVGGAPPAGVAATATPPAGSSGAAPGPTALVNLNTATETELDALPEVGPVTAASILTWRDQHGGFTSVDELLEVDGIGEVTLGKLAPYVTV